MSRRLLLLGLSLLALSTAGPAVAAEPLPTPLGFRLPASNGYTLSVLAGENPKFGGFVLVLLNSSRAEVAYVTHASVTATSIEADLGPIGRIDVDFVATGEPRTEGSSCDEEQVSFDAGSYVGSIDFEGEGGYSKAHASSARGEIRTALGLVCADRNVAGSGGHSPGAQLTARHGGSKHRFEFEAMKNSPTRPARFQASIEERRGTLRIVRSVESEAGPAAFDFDVPQGFARVAPPAPFAGEATYRRPSGKHARWRGDLTVDFPGRPDVRLTGPGTRAGMHREVLNPSHPFRAARRET